MGIQGVRWCACWCGVCSALLLRLYQIFRLWKFWNYISCPLNKEPKWRHIKNIIRLFWLRIMRLLGRELWNLFLIFWLLFLSLLHLLFNLCLLWLTPSLFLKRFVAGFFFASIPWYVGAFILLFVAQDHREKPGLIACSIAVSMLRYESGIIVVICVFQMFLNFPFSPHIILEVFVGYFFKFFCNLKSVVLFHVK